jgi:hypothetical protein
VSACKQCGLPVRWVRDGDRWKCLNQDGIGDGVVYDERKRYMHIGCESIRGERYRPDGCDCGRPAWELCTASCQHAIGAPR